MSVDYVSALSVVRYCTAPGCGLRLSVLDVDLCLSCVEAGRKPQVVMPTPTMQRINTCRICAAPSMPGRWVCREHFSQRQEQDATVRKIRERNRRRQQAEQRSQGHPPAPARPRGSAGS